MEIQPTKFSSHGWCMGKIGTVSQTALKVILKRRLVDDFSNATIFTEIESIMNSRPLTAISDDINDLEALTQNHFLLGRSSSIS